MLFLSIHLKYCEKNYCNSGGSATDSDFTSVENTKKASLGTDAKGPAVHHGRFSTSGGDAKRYDFCVPCAETHREKM